jgi:hypothetical protein
MRDQQGTRAKEDRRDWVRLVADDLQAETRIERK